MFCMSFLDITGVVPVTFVETLALILIVILIVTNFRCARIRCARNARSFPSVVDSSWIVCFRRKHTEKCSFFRTLGDFMGPGMLCQSSPVFMI